MADPLAALAALEARRRATVEAALDAIVTIDLDGRVVEFNPAAQAMFGWRASEAEGQLLAELIIPPAHREAHRAGLARMRDTGQAAILGKRLRLSALRRDGTEFPVELAVVPLAGTDPPLYTGFVRDCSGEREADALLRAAVEASPAAKLMVAADGTIRMANAAAVELFGYAPDELLGLGVERLVPPEVRAQHATLRAGFLARPERRPMGAGRDLAAIRRDGTRVPVEIALTPVRVAGETLVLASIVDITARQRAEAERERLLLDLQRSNTELEQFAYVASHDLREPLRMVASYCQLIAERYGGRLDPKADRFLEFAVEGATRMQRMIDDLLEYSRIGTHGGAPVPTDCGAVLALVRTDLAAAIADAGTAVTHDPLPVVHADPDQVRRLLANLVSNAVKFRAEAPSRVHVAARPSGSHWELSVADNGIGVPAEHAGRVFQMFQRLHERGKYPGNGIGLAIAKRIVERHGGRIWVEPADGGGSVFRLTLPAAEGAP